MSATLTLEEAARFLQLYPTTLAAKARSGEIPGAKLGESRRRVGEYFHPELESLSSASDGFDSAV